MPDREEPWPRFPGDPAPGAGTGFGPEPLSDIVARRLLAQRVVLLNGPLDDFSVTRVAAELMTLDAEGDDPVTLRVDCGEAAWRRR
jgi:ATP-dependent Clp protease, protease subunit